MPNKFECRARPTPATRFSPQECRHCERRAPELFCAIAKRHGGKEAARIFSRIAADDFASSGISLSTRTPQDLVRLDNASLLEDLDAAMKASPNMAAFVKGRAAQNKKIFETYAAARKSQLLTKERYAAGLEILLRERLERIDELTARIDHLRRTWWRSVGR